MILFLYILDLMIKRFLLLMLPCLFLPFNCVLLSIVADLHL